MNLPISSVLERIFGIGDGPTEPTREREAGAEAELAFAGRILARNGSEGRDCRGLGIAATLAMKSPTLGMGALGEPPC